MDGLLPVADCQLPLPGTAFPFSSASQLFAGDLIPKSGPGSGMSQLQKASLMLGARSATR